MAQADGIVSNGSGAAVRADINNQLAAVFTNHSGTTEPTTTYAYQFWADTTNNLLKIRNSTNTGWVTLRQLDGEFDTLPVENGTNSAPSIYFKDSGTDSGFYSPGTDQVAVSTIGVQRVNFNAATEVVFNDTGADVDFRIEGDTEENLFVIDAGTDQVRVKNLNGGPLAGARNRVINGDMRISQRGTSFTALSLNTGNYTLDRWSTGGGNNTAVGTITQSTNTPNNTFEYSLKLDVTTADASVAATDRSHLIQSIEGYNAVDLVGQTFTLSFWVKSPKTGTHCVAFHNSVSDRSYVTEYTVSLANTWEYKTITVTGGLITDGTWDFTNGAGLRVLFTLMAGTTYQGTAGSWLTGNIQGTSSQVNVLDSTANDFFLCGVQLEPGSVATPFERRNYGHELALCQRYALVYAADATYSTPHVAPGIANTTTNGAIFLSAPTPMRVYPSISVSSASHFLFGAPVNGTISTITATATASQFATDSSQMRIDVTGTGFTVGAATFRCNNASAKLTLSAEL